MNPYYFTLVVQYPESDKAYRVKKTFKSEKTARNQVAKLTLQDESISYISVKQVMDLNNWELSLATK